MAQPTSKESQADLAKEYAGQSGGESQDALAREYTAQTTGGAGGSYDQSWAHGESPISYQWASEHPVAATAIKSFDIGNVLNNAWKGGKDLVQGGVAMGKDLLQNPNWFTGPNSTANKFLFKPADEQWAKADEAYKQGRFSEAQGRSLAAVIPFVGPWAANLGEQAGTGDIGGAAGNAAGTMLTGSGVSKVAETPEQVAALKGAFSTGLKAVTHDLLSKAADNAKQTLWESHAKVSARVGGLKSDIANADYADGGNKIVVSDLMPKIDQIIQDYKAAGTSLPKFDAAIKALAEVDSPTISFEQAADLRSAIGSLSAKAVEGTRDAGAMGQIEQALKQKLSDRAEELDQTQKFKDYNGLWSTLKGYEATDKPLGKLLNAPDGQTFFKHLNDPVNAQGLKRVNDSLLDFGLPKDYFKDLRNAHAAGYRYVMAKPGGKLSAIARHPVAGTAGAIVGAGALSPVPGVGHWVGGLLGAQAGGLLADRVAAAREIQAQGGAPSTVGEMKQFKSQPSGQEVNRPAAPNQTMAKDLVDALVSQGFDKKTATAQAIRAMQQNPNGDFGSLFSTAIRRP